MARQTSALPILLLTTLAALAGGFFIGFQFRGPAPSEVQAVDSDAQSPSNPNEAGLMPEPPTLVAPNATENGRAKADNPHLGQVSEASVQRAVAGTHKPEIEALTGEGLVQGRVLDQEGQPMAGVRISLIPPQSQVSMAPSASEGTNRRKMRGLEETLERAAKRWAESDGLARSAESDSEGKFILRDLPDLNYTVRAELDGWSFRTEGPSTVKPGAQVLLKGKPMPSFRLELTASDGTVIDRAYVRLSRYSGDWMLWTADNPIVRSDKSQTTVQAIADLYEELSANWSPVGRLTSEAVPVDIAADGSTVVALELEPNAILTGRLEGSRHGFNSVFAYRLRDGERFDPTLKLRGNREANGSNGSYIISDLLPGRYAVGQLGNDQKVLSHEIIDIVDGINTHNLEKHDLDLTRCVAVRTLSPSGARIDQVSYQFEWERPGQDRDTEGVRVFRDVDGLDLVDIDNFYSFDIDDWPEGTQMWLTASASAYGKSTVPYAKGQTSAEIQFSAPCELEVTLNGELQEGSYSVSVHDASRGPDDMPQLRSATQTARSGRTRISRKGVVRFRGLTPGPVVVRFKRSLGYWGGGIVIEEQSLQLTGTDHHLNFHTPALNDVELVVTPTKKERGIRLRVRDEKEDDGERNVMWAQTNDAGRVVFLGIPAGDYIVVDTRTGARLELAVPSPQVHWDLSDHVLRVTVSVSKADDKLAEWGFEGGDVIVAMDGQPIEERKDILDRLHDQEVTLSVERGEQTLEIQVPAYPRETRGKNPLGGRFYIDN